MFISNIYVKKFELKSCPESGLNLCASFAQITLKISNIQHSEVDITINDFFCNVSLSWQNFPQQLLGQVCEKKGEFFQESLKSKCRLHFLHWNDNCVFCRCWINMVTSMAERGLLSCLVWTWPLWMSVPWHTERSLNQTLPCSAGMHWNCTLVTKNH